MLAENATIPSRDTAAGRRVRGLGGVSARVSVKEFNERRSEWVACIFTTAFALRRTIGTVPSTAQAG